MKISRHLAAMALLTQCLAAVVASTTSVVACVGQKPFTSDDYLKIQLPIIDQGLVREQLSESDRQIVIAGRKRVVELQKAGNRKAARAVMVDVIALFKLKPNNIEPIAVKCGPIKR